MITFRGQHTGHVMMFDQHALTLLRMMGTSGRRKGALMAEDIPAALAALEAALEPHKEESEALAKTDEPAPGDPAGRKVGIYHRAVPLLELLREAVEHGDYVTWG